MGSLKSAQPLKYPLPLDFSKVIWMDAAETAISDYDRTVDLPFTDLDLTAITSPNAKFAILRMRIKADTVGPGNHSYIAIRKNGTSPVSYPWLRLDKAGTTVGVYNFEVVIVGLDSEQVIEYKIDVGGGWQVDSTIQVLGYIE